MLHSRKRKYLIIAVVILIVMVLTGWFAYSGLQPTYAGKTEPITLGVFPSEYCSLIYIAKDQQYFSANGLKVTLKNYSSGAAADSGLLKGEVDIATASEFVVVRNALQSESVWALGSISKYLNLYFVARTEQGINNVSDLEGKRIGISLGTGLQFYLGRYMDLNSINHSQVTLVDVAFAEAPTALENGTVDAVMTFQPYLNEIYSLLDNKTLTWKAQADQFGYFEVICTRDWGMAHPDLIERFLKTLVQAEEYNLNHHDQAISIVANALSYANAYTASVWTEYQYSVTLDQSFIVLMQDEARWLIGNNLTSAVSLPNFLNYVYVDGLRSVRPASVNIIGLDG
jgi:ABC-type nitrate/sulfonate/bicarbonate transport system substrate-binding protein